MTNVPEPSFRFAGWWSLPPPNRHRSNDKQSGSESRKMREIRRDKKAGLRRDAIRIQVIDALEAHGSDLGRAAHQACGTCVAKPVARRNHVLAARSRPREACKF